MAFGLVEFGVLVRRVVLEFLVWAMGSLLLGYFRWLLSVQYVTENLSELPLSHLVAHEMKAEDSL